MRTVGLPPELKRSRWRPTLEERRQLARERYHFTKVRNAEVWYARQLRAVSRHIGKLAEPFADSTNPSAVAEFERMMQRYSEILHPWAEVQAERLIADVSRRDAMAWFNVARRLGISLRDMIENTPLGQEIRQLLDTQVGLITSLPLDAARRVQEQALGAVTGGLRNVGLRDAIRSTSDVSLSRATLIARTETARAASVISTTRARSIGVTHFIWETARDVDVRPLHQKYQSKIYAYDDPPILDDGRPGLPGTIWNCRCWSNPIITP